MHVILCHCQILITFVVRSEGFSLDLRRCDACFCYLFQARYDTLPRKYLAEIIAHITIFQVIVCIRTYIETSRRASSRNASVMPPPLNHTSLHLQVLSERFFVARLRSGVHLPPCALRLFTDSDPTSFFSVTRTGEEISLVGESHEWMPDSLKQYSCWRCIKVKGPMEHGGCLLD